MRALRPPHAAWAGEQPGLWEASAAAPTMPNTGLLCGPATPLVSTCPGDTKTHPNLCPGVPSSATGKSGPKLESRDAETHTLCPCGGTWLPVQTKGPGPLLRPG